MVKYKTLTFWVSICLKLRQDTIVSAGYRKKFNPDKYSKLSDNPDHNNSVMTNW